MLSDLHLLFVVSELCTAVDHTVQSRLHRATEIGAVIRCLVMSSRIVPHLGNITPPELYQFLASPTDRYVHLRLFVYSTCTYSLRWRLTLPMYRLCSPGSRNCMYCLPYMVLVVYGGRGRPGGSVGNLEIFWRWDVSSNLGAVTRTGIFSHIMPNKWRTIMSWIHKSSTSRSTRERNG